VVAPSPNCYKLGPATFKNVIRKKASEENYQVMLQTWRSHASIKMSEFKNEGGQLSGRLVTDGKQEAFDQTWEVDLTFKTKAP